MTKNLTHQIPWKRQADFSACRLVTGLTFLLIVAAIFHVSRTVDAAISDRIVAVVNGDVITLSELEAKAQPLFRKFLKEDDPEASKIKRQEILARLLQQLVDEKLVEGEIRRTGIRVEPKEEEEALARICENSHLTLEQLATKLAEEGTSLEDYKVELRREIERTRLINAQVRAKIVITDGQIKAYLEEHPSQEEVHGPQYVLQHICIISDPPQDPAARAAAREKAEEAWKALQAGEDFASVAQRYSDSPSAQEGGRLGAFALEDLTSSIREIVIVLEPGGFSPVMDTPAGWQIFRLQKILEGAEATEAARREEIRQKLYQIEINARFREWLRELRAKSAIRILL